MERREPGAPRPIRTYVRREGRLTPGQERALQALWPAYGLEPQPGGGPWDLDAAFGRRAPRVLEIGCGTGDFLLAQASAHPEQDHLGIEVYRPGMGRLLRRLRELGLTNLRLVCADAAEVLRLHLVDGSLTAVYLLFPDPWPKRRHHKRRIVQPDFVQLVRRKLTPGGIFHLATDWEDYARHMLRVLEQAEGLENCAGPGRCSAAGRRPVTRFQRRGERLGHGVWDLRYRRID